MAKAKKKRAPVKRKDGKATRAERSKSNKTTYADAKRAFAGYMPPVAAARYKVLIDELKAGVPCETPSEKQKVILSLIIGGLSLRWAREIVSVSHYQWHLWLHEDENLKKEYALAKEERTETWADDIMDDADAANAFNVQAVRLRIETKKWLMGKHSGRYAEKSTVVHTGDEAHPVRIINEQASAKEAQDAYNAMKGHDTNAG